MIPATGPSTETERTDLVERPLTVTRLGLIREQRSSGFQRRPSISLTMTVAFESRNATAAVAPWS
jgi:hypothetical protein